MPTESWNRRIYALINSWISELGSGFGLRFRLPAPVAFAKVTDVLWTQIKRTHPWVALPQELLPEAKSVIVYAVPLTLEAIRSNVESAEPSVEWLRDYAYANKIINETSKRVAELLEREGYASVSLKATHDFDDETLRASWSHKHAGYVAGLGTFGANRLLITKKGCAVRLGSVVTALELEPTARPKFEYCLEKRGFRCGKCVERCPVGALSDWDRGKFDCWHRLQRIDRENKTYAEAFGGPLSACGKCAVGIPCATRVPRAPSTNATIT